VAGHWVRRQGGWVWIAGHWQNSDYDPKTQHRLCDFNAGLTKKSHVWEEANTKIQTKLFLRPSGAPCRAGSIESNKRLQPTLSCLTIQLL
jgi:hypothetical protein